MPLRGSASGVRLGGFAAELAVCVGGNALAWGARGTRLLDQITIKIVLELGLDSGLIRG
jgi:hypothetical protein